MLYKPTRLERIKRCVDEMEDLKRFGPNSNCLLQTLGQMDWLDQLHHELYEEQDTPQQTGGFCEKH